MSLSVLTMLYYICSEFSQLTEMLPISANKSLAPTTLPSDLRMISYSLSLSLTCGPFDFGDFFFKSVEIC